MRRPILVTLVVSSLLGAAEAKRLATPGEEDPAPRPTLVVGKLDGNLATLTVRYDLRSAEPTLGRNVTSIELPARAAVVRATARVDGVAHPLELTDATQASARFDAIIDLAPGPNRRWSVLVAGGQGQVEVSIASAHAGRVVLELELQLPTCFFRDVRYVAVPSDWRTGLSPSLRTLGAKLTDIDEACGGANPGGQLWVGLPSRELTRPQAAIDRVGTFAGRLALGTTHIARLELDVAGMLAGVPADLATAIVIDGSRSLSRDELEVQRALVESYLRKAPAGRVQVIAYARRARPLLPRWTTASQASPRLDDLLDKLATANGSNVEAGLAEAGRWLSQTTGTRRIVLVTDERLADALAKVPAASLRTLVPAGTLIHVVALSADDEAPVRADDVALAPLAAATLGIAIRTGLPEGGLDATLLVRPITVDKIVLNTPGWTELADAAETCPDTLAAGRACTWWGEGDVLAGPIAVEAFVWGQRIARVLHPDLGQATALARELTSLGTLEQSLQDRAALAAHAVNAKWALYAEWGGGDGYSDMLGGIIGSMCGGSSDLGATGTSGGGLVSLRAAPPPFDLHAQLAVAVGRCSLGGATVDADVENTLHEIVAVQVVVHPAGAMSAGDQQAVQGCVEEAIWGTAIIVPPEYPHQTTHVAFAQP